MERNKIKRIDFFRSGFQLLLEETKLLTSSLKKPKIRPPGAKREDEFLRNCTGCEECQKICSHNAIQMVKTHPTGDHATPVIRPELSPCQMCEDLPCVTACNHNALNLQNKKKIGIAKILKETCFAHNGQICDYCFDRCPNKNEAIVMKGRLPIVNQNKCSGCGICVYFCPAPGKGIKVLPENVIR